MGIEQDLDNAVIGKIELNNQMIAIYLAKLFRIVGQLEEKIDDLKKEIQKE